MPARARTVAILAVGTTFVVWLVLWQLDGIGVALPRLPWPATVATAATAVVVIAAGLPVRRWVRGKRERRLDPMVATRTLVLAKAAAYGGALLAGWFVGQALVLLPELVGDRRYRFILAVISAIAAVALAAAGLVVQSWCKLPPEDDAT